MRSGGCAGREGLKLVTYKYSAISDSGEKVNGVIEGFNQLDAVDRIKQNCKIVLSLSEVKENEEKLGFLNTEIGGNKLHMKAFIVMCNQFAIILHSGVPIARTVRLIVDKTTDKALRSMLKNVASDVESGRSLSASFTERGEKILPVTFIETIRAGEESGSVDRAFSSMAQSFEKSTKIAAKVRSALAYPIFVLTIAVIVVILLMVKVVPTFMAIFEDLGAELPFITQLLIDISHFFQRSWLYLLGIVVALILFFKIYGNTESGRLNLAKLALRVPILGNIQQLNAASQFSNTMTSMLAVGLPLTRAVSITAKVITNYYISQEVGKLSGKLEEGRALGVSLRESACMPDILTDMVSVGEETGEMESTLRTIAAYYDNEVMMATDAAVRKIEPTLLVGMAVIAGFIVIAIYMAMFSMYGNM